MRKTLPKIPKNRKKRACKAGKMRRTGNIPWILRHLYARLLPCAAGKENLAGQDNGAGLERARARKHRAFPGWKKPSEAKNPVPLQARMRRLRHCRGKGKRKARIKRQ